MKTSSTLETGGPISSQNQKTVNSSLKKFFVLPVIILFFTSARSLAQSMPAYPTLSFNSPVLISGTDLQVNAVYKFPNVVAGVDAHVTIMGMSGGAWLSEIDNTSGAGYYDAFQPYVGAGAQDTSYIDWKFVFKKAGTSIDTILPLLAVTGIDVDGDNSSLKEFIQAATPGSFALDPDTYLDFSFDGVRSTATSTTSNYPLIDTANTKSMFQMNFTKINTILYRNGSITTGGSQVRQTSIYFKSFFNYMTLLPVKLLSFDAKKSGDATVVNWSAAEEDDLNYYTVQKSTDGIKWKDVARVIKSATGGSNSYSVTDKEKNNSTVYYRLQQLNTTGFANYSKTVRLVLTASQTVQITKSYASNNKINLYINTKNNDDYVFDVYTVNGTKVVTKQSEIYTGNSQYSLDLPSASGKGIYLLVIKNKSGELIYNAKIPVI